MTITPVAIIGAGPYGLSLSAHLGAKGVEHRIFGRPMSAWAEQMPARMYLKSEGFASSLGDPRGEHTLRRYCDARQNLYGDSGVPISLQTFLDYGRAFAADLVPQAE